MEEIDEIEEIEEIEEYKKEMKKELKIKWKNLNKLVEPDSDDEDEEVRLTSLCNEILLDASEVGDYKKIFRLIDSVANELGVDIDAEMLDEPLLLASGNGYPDIVELLIQHSANVNFASRGDTPLIKVAQNSIMNKDKQLNIVEQLIKAKADVNHKGDYGKTPLILATESNSPKIVSKLLESGADLNIKDDEEDTALTIAVSFDMEEIIQIIQDYQNEQNEPKTSVKKGRGTKKRKKNKRRQKINKSKRRKVI